MRYLFQFGFETPAEFNTNSAGGWDDESSEAIWINAPSTLTCYVREYGAFRKTSYKSSPRRHHWPRGGGILYGYARSSARTEPEAARANMLGSGDHRITRRRGRTDTGCCRAGPLCGIGRPTTAVARPHRP